MRRRTHSRRRVFLCGLLAFAAACVIPASFAQTVAINPYRLLAGATLTYVSNVLNVLYGTTANTAAQGNDSRIVGAVQTSTANLPNGYLSLDASGYPHIGNNSATAAAVYLNTAAGSYRLIGLQTAGQMRWNMGATATTESGSNAGSDWALYRYADNGAALDFPLLVSRATGRVTAYDGLQAIGGLATDTFTASSTLSLNAVKAGPIGSNWSAGDFVVGNPGVQGAALGMHYDGTANVAHIGAIAPGVAWYPIVIEASTVSFLGYGANQGLFQQSNGWVGVGNTNPAYNLDVTGTARVSGTTVLGAGIQAHRTAVSDAPYTVLASDYLVAMTALTATRAVTLPCTTTGSAVLPQYFVVKDESGNASPSNPITLVGTVDGSTTRAITVPYGVAQVYATGSGCGTW